MEHQPGLSRAVTLVLGLAAPGIAWASDQTGVYARPLAVVYEPSATDAVRIRIQGVAAVANNTVYPGYTTPACGYLYYACPAGLETMCRMQWADVARAAQAGTCVSFLGRRGVGGALVDNARVRAFAEPAAAPDPYDLRFSMGVATVPCTPMLDRPDLNVACTIPAALPPDAAPTPPDPPPGRDAGPPLPEPPAVVRDAPAALPDAATADAPIVQPAPVNDAGPPQDAAPDPPLSMESSGCACALGGRRQRHVPLAMALAPVAFLLSRWRTRRRP